MPKPPDHRVCSRVLNGSNPCIDGDAVTWIVNQLDTSVDSFAKLIGSERQLVLRHGRGEGKIGPLYNAIYDLIYQALKRSGPETTFRAMESCKSMPQLFRALAWLTTSEDELVMFMKMHVGRDIRGIPST